MTTLLLVIGISLAISFICSILEAVLLSISHSYVAILQERGHPAGDLLARMRANIDEPIAAILTLNTIAHTVGASVGGAIALEVFGNEWIALFSAVLTLLILVLSEILPKTIGATFWQGLAPLAAQVLRWMILLMKPILIPLALFNRLITPKGERGSTVSRAELEVLAEIGRRDRRPYPGLKDRRHRYVRSPDKLPELIQEAMDEIEAYIASLPSPLADAGLSQDDIAPVAPAEVLMCGSTRHTRKLWIVS